MTLPADPNSLGGRYQQTLLQQQQQQLAANPMGTPELRHKTMLNFPYEPQGEQFQAGMRRKHERDDWERYQAEQGPLTPMTPEEVLISQLSHPPNLLYEKWRQQYKPPEQPFQQPQPLPGLDFRAQAEQLQRGQTGPQSFNQQQLPPTLPPQIGQQQFGNSGIGSLGGGGQTNVSLNLQGSATMNPSGQGGQGGQGKGYTGWSFAEGGAVNQQLVPFQPTYSQGIGSLRPYQAPVMPPMEASPQDYRQSPQYAPTNQYSIQPRQAAPLVNASSIDSGTPTFQPTQPVSNSTSAIQYDPSTQRYSSNPSYAPPPPPAAEVDYDEGGEGEKAGGRIRAYARGGSTPQGLASLGRGQDSMLVHMSPNEVQGLQQLAMSAGGSLTINPQTGLPEAGFLSSMLPMIAGIGLNMAFPGSGALIGAGIGGLTALTSGSLKKGLMAGLGAYGGASLGGGLEAAGAQQAEALKAADLSKAMIEATPTSGSAAADLAFKQAQTVNSTANIEELVKQAAANPEKAMSPKAYQEFLTNQASSTVGPTGDQIVEAQRARMLNAIQNAPMRQATQDALDRSPFQNSMQGIKELTGQGTGTASDAFKGLIGNAANEKTGVEASGLGGYPGAAKTLGMAAAPLLSSAMEPGKFNPPAKTPTQYSKFDYRPPKYNPETGNYDPASYGPGSYYTNPTQYAAQGGAVGYDQGGIARFYPLTGDKVNMSAAPGGLGGAGEKRKYSLEINDPDSGAGINDNKAGRGVYSDVGGIYENTPSDVEGLFAKTSAANLSKYLKARSPVKQAAALAELRKRANAVYDYADDTISAAQGGLMGLNTYAAGGRLLRGPGDGMSDSIPAVIRGARPQRAALADGEFVIPADVVSHLGNGSTEAGSKRLYSMMNRIRKARTGNPKQGKQINPERFMPA